MVHRNNSPLFMLLFTFLCVSPAQAIDTLQVISPDPLLDIARWTEFDRRSGLAGRTSSEYVCEDREGNIWFATDQGAQKYDGLHWKTYTTEDGLAHNNVAKIRQARDGTMLIGTGSLPGEQNPSVGFTWLVETNSTQAKVTTHTFDGWAYFDGLLEAKDGSIWVGLGGGNQDDIHDIRRYINGQWETIKPPRRTIAAIVQDREGAIWTGTMKGITLRFDGVRWTQFQLSPNTTLTPSNTHRPSVDATGNIYVEHDGGTSRFDNGVWKRLTLPPGPIHHTSSGIT